jgi:hypothetical protein
LIYSEEIIENDVLNISYEKLIDMLNIKEPYDKNNCKNFIWKNHNDNNEYYFHQISKAVIYDVQ